MRSWSAPAPARMLTAPVVTSSDACAATGSASTIVRPRTNAGPGPVISFPPSRLPGSRLRGSRSLHLWSGERLFQEGNGARPGEIGRLFIIARLRGVVVEGVVDVVIHEQLIVDPGRLQRRLVIGDAGTDALVEPGI